MRRNDEELKRRICLNFSSVFVMSRRLSIVSFDAVSTLIKPGGGGVGRQYASAAERLVGRKYDPDVLQSAFLKEFKRQRNAFPNYGNEQNMSERQWWVDVVMAAFETASPDSRPATEQLLRVASHLFDNFEWELYPNVRQLLHHLKFSKGLQLCVVSNSDERLGAVLRDKDLSAYFDLVLTSRGVGAEKPDDRIFKRVLQHFADENGAPMTPERVLHVGDDVVCDFDAAKSLGMRAALVDHRQSMAKADWICHDLIELQRMIDAMIDA